MKKLHRTVLSAALGEAVRHEVLKTSPAVGAGVQKRKHEDVANDAKSNCWSVDEALTFLRTVDAESDPQMAGFFHLAIDSGCRKSELSGLTWDRIDLDKHTIRVDRQLDSDGRAPVFGPTKTRRSRDIEITAQTVDRLRAHRREQSVLKMANRTSYANSISCSLGRSATGDRAPSSANRSRRCPRTASRRSPKRPGTGHLGPRPPTHLRHDAALGRRAGQRRRRTAGAQERRDHARRLRPRATVESAPDGQPGRRAAGGRELATFR